MRRLINNNNAPVLKPIAIGRFGKLRKAYLANENRQLYIAFLASEKLDEHCAMIDKEARWRISELVPQIAKSAGVTEELKAADSFKWIGLMNTCRSQAEEIVIHELICVR